MNGLSSREGDVLGLVIGGLTIAEISRRLWISPETTKTHLAHIRKKFGVLRMTDIRAAGILAEMAANMTPNVSGAVDVAASPGGLDE